MVSVFDTTTFSLQETLPFKQISHMTTYISPIGASYFAISTKFMVIVYTWEDDQLEVIKQYKLNDKIVTFEIINEDLIIASSKSQFYSLRPSSSNEPTKVDFHSQYSFFNQQTSIIPNGGNEVLLAKGSHASKIGIYNTIKSNPIHWDINPHSIKFIPPFLMLFSGNHVRLLDFDKLKVYQALKIPKVDQFHKDGDRMVFTSKDSIYLYKMSSFDKIVEDLKKDNLEKAIELVSQLNTAQFPERSLRLRSLEIEIGIQLFKAQNYHAAISKFSKFIAPPMKVISLYPSNISGIVSENVYNKETEEQEPPIDQKAIQLLIHYLTDIRRKFNKVVNAEGHELEYLDSKLTPSSFTEDEYSIDDIRRAIDSALFRCYTETNSGLIGSLVRVDNYCDTDLVVNTFRSKKMINELIDFYYKKGLHEEALNLLVDLCQETQMAPDLVVKYLQKLKNDNLELILKYADWPISVMESYGIEIFLNSHYSETFNRQQVAKYLASKSRNLERIYLEYIIVELKDKSKLFNTRLVEIYYDCLKEENYKQDSIHYKKLYTFLQSGDYDPAQTLKIAETNKSKESHLRLLETFILKKLNKHEEALKILVTDVDDSNMAIHYVNQLFLEDSKTATKYFLRLITLFWGNSDKSSILKLLSTSKDSNIPIVDILRNLPSEFKIHEIEHVLIKSLRLQQKLNSFSNLSKNLRAVENVKIEEKLMNLQNQKNEVIANETRCQVCHSYLANSVLSRFPDGNLVHFGCTKAYQQLIDDKNKIFKLKTMKLKDYAVNNVT